MRKTAWMTDKSLLQLTFDAHCWNVQYMTRHRMHYRSFCLCNSFSGKLSYEAVTLIVAHFGTFHYHLRLIPHQFRSTFFSITLTIVSNFFYKLFLSISDYSGHLGFFSSSLLTSDNGCVLWAFRSIIIDGNASWIHRLIIGTWTNRQITWIPYFSVSSAFKMFHSILDDWFCMSMTKIRCWNWRQVIIVRVQHAAQSEKPPLRILLFMNDNFQSQVVNKWN